MSEEDRVKRDKISACVMTFNEEDKIRRCLESLTWCDEIVVADSFSSDRTVEICKEFTDRVYQHAWRGYIGQRNLLREMAHHPWILFLDADEEVSSQLRDEILREFRAGSGDVVGYEFPRKVLYLGRWITHGEWYPDIKLRLFRKELGRSVGREPHDRVDVSGPVKRLGGDLLHYTYDNIHDQLRRVNKYSTITAEEKFRAGVRASWSDILLRPSLRFLKGYVLRRGFMDGRRGLLIAMINSFEVCMKYAKLWELWWRASREGMSPKSAAK